MRTFICFFSIALAMNTPLYKDIEIGIGMAITIIIGVGASVLQDINELTRK